ncbi:uncharacterized protein BJ171DRAFT_424725 [Polychytrium aggregatum]|uniref:uncharacterized protein n=1 Tax=Polychytrium aggregatum TaxID=110093 RepID=UPI0022FE7747|nr:uncharacterized protein BJ171DRAFT_424725 [Polychytrium aggregatum]KAI9204069.1 hypothetical protein BJ171DRAFT_424725 [Polychytrium aggregatum]
MAERETCTYSALLNPTPLADDRPLQLDDRTYHRHADEYLDSVAHHLEELGDEIELEGFDVLFANGVITLKLGSKGTFVLNKQPPNKQIWLSSPISGPMRFDLIEDNGRTQWIYHRGNVKLTELLNKELTQLLDRDVDVESNMDD